MLEKTMITFGENETNTSKTVASRYRAIIEFEGAEPVKISGDSGIYSYEDLFSILVDEYKDDTRAIKRIELELY